MAHKLPAHAGVSRRIQVDLRRAQIGGDAVASEQNGALFERGKVLSQLVQKRLVAKPPAIGLVRHVGNVRPGSAVVCRAVDGEVDGRGLRGVVFPGSEEGIVRQGELDGACVQDPWIGVVRGWDEEGLVFYRGDRV